MSASYDTCSLIHTFLAKQCILICSIGVIHADLKPENVLLCSRKKGAETVKLIDFGCASVEKRGESLFFERRNTMMSSMPSIGTKAYWSPERFKPGAKPTELADLYAVGIILFIMLVGVHPFDVKGIASDEEIEKLIQKSSGPPMHLASHLSPSARDFIKGLMEKDPNKRLTAITALRVSAVIRHI